jgi:hypothetical protein
VSQDLVKTKPTDRLMDNWAVDRLIDWAAGKKGKEKTKAELDKELCDLAADLAGPTPSPVERVLAETAATCWFAFRMHEAHNANCGAQGGMTISQSDHSQRRLDRAHRRLLSTLRTLATVRRLARPSMQINVAQQQVNQLNTGGTQ